MMSPMTTAVALALVLQIAVAGVAWGQNPDHQASRSDREGAEEATATEKRQTAQAARTLENQPAEETEPLAEFADPTFGPQYTIERIVVRGNRKTEAALILAELGLYPGDQVTASDRRVEAGRIRLLALGFFLAFPYLCFMLGAPFGKFFHSCSFIKQAELYTTQQMLEIKDTFKAQNAANSIGGLSTFVQPIQCSLPVQLNGSGHSQRIVSTKFLNEFTIAGSTGIGNYDEVERPLFGAMTLESDLY